MLPMQLTNASVGIILKELVRRSITIIRNERFKFEVTEKTGYDGTADDMFTSADTAAQAVYESGFRECFPGIGMIGEEDSPDIPCTLDGVDAYFTVDPLDGTKAFVRRQSQGTATMVALVIEGQVVSAWIGDINTQEIYGYRPGSRKVHRISQYEVSQYLHENEFQQDISQGYALLRDPLCAAPDQVHRFANSFKSHNVEGSSIGTWMARLWKGEVLAGVMGPAHQTPWDDTPIVGISRKLGFVYLRSDGETSWKQYEPALVKEVVERPYWTAVIHKSNLDQLPI